MGQGILDLRAHPGRPGMLSETWQGYRRWLEVIKQGHGISSLRVETSHRSLLSANSVTSRL